MRSTSSSDDPDLPALEERLVEPETRYEILDGELVYLPYADEVRGSRLVDVSTLIGAHVHVAFHTGLNVLMRTSKIDDIALNVSVRASAPEPGTGHRPFPRLAFEIVHTEALDYSGRKAAKWCGRGARVFAIDVDDPRVLEWCTALGSWTPLASSGHIEDLALAVPLSVRVLAGEFNCLDHVAHVLLARRNPVLLAAQALDRAERHATGTVSGKGQALITFLTARRFSLDVASRERILNGPEPANLDRWIVRAANCATIDEMFAGA